MKSFTTIYNLPTDTDCAYFQFLVSTRRTINSSQFSEGRGLTRSKHVKSNCPKISHFSHMRARLKNLLLFLWLTSLVVKLFKTERILFLVYALKTPYYIFRPLYSGEHKTNPRWTAGECWQPRYTGCFIFIV